MPFPLPKNTPTADGPWASMTARTRDPRSSRHVSQVVSAEHAVDPHHRALDAVGVVVQLRQRAALRTRVAVRERVVVVAADPDDLVARHVDEDPAHRGADAAEAPDRAHVSHVHRTPRFHRRSSGNIVLSARTSIAGADAARAGGPTARRTRRRRRDATDEPLIAAANELNIVACSTTPAIRRRSRPGRTSPAASASVEQLLEQHDERREGLRRLLRVRRQQLLGELHDRRRRPGGGWPFGVSRHIRKYSTAKRWSRSSGSSALGDDVREMRGGGPDRLLEQREQELVLAREVLVEGAQRLPGAFDHLLDGELARVACS